MYVIALRSKTHVQAFALGAANEALRRLRAGAIEGAAVLVMSPADD